MTKTCVDCGTRICHKATRCKSCASRFRWEQGFYDSEESRQKKSRHCKQMWESGQLGGEEWKRKISEGSKAAWKRGCFDGKTRERMAKAFRRRWASGSMDSRDTPEYRQKLSEASKAAWKRGVFDGVYQSPTSIELKVAAALDVCSIQHKSQYRPKGYSRVFDEFVPPDIFIEVNGDYWHGNPARYADSELDKKQQNRRESDVEKAGWTKENGYHLVTFWEREIEEFGAWSLVLSRVLPLLEGVENESHTMEIA